MSKYTAQLRTIVDNNINIFDFDYTRTPESIAIISNEQLQNDFIDRYYFREIGFETVERFKHYLKVKWKEELGEFDALLVAYNEKINVKSNMKAQIDNTTIFFGNIEKHPKYHRIKKFCLKNNSDIKILCPNMPLTDIGGIVRI